MFETDSRDDDMEEDETEWINSFTETEPSSCAAVSGSNLSKTQTPMHRVILHFDLDCFYAQVEMIRNPALREVPLGIQQKYIIVTCNYVAREQGVTKLMSVTDAKEKCPHLVLVNGEDLTHYREMSYKVTELLLSSCPLVERLGFDENYVDVTELVDRRLAQAPESNPSFKGHVYNNPSGGASYHPRLALGSHIAAELRDAIREELGLTGCAGIATNKLLAKLVSGTFKPNQQTTLLPGNAPDIMGSLSSLRRVPGVGHQTAKRLQALGLLGVQDLQLCPSADLTREFGGPGAQRLKNLALGIDDSPVTPTGAPQSLSDEDSFKKMSSTKDVTAKIRQLLSSLLERMHKDGRQPQTLRLTIRRYSAANKWFSRQSRQCPLPNHLGQKITSGSPSAAGRDEALDQLVLLAMKLFQKMVDPNAGFHLTLISVCFSNLQSRRPSAAGRSSITSFFKHATTADSSPAQGGSSSSRERHCTDDGSDTHAMITVPPRHETAGSPSGRRGASAGSRGKQSSSVPGRTPGFQTASGGAVMSKPEDANTSVTHGLPPDVDPDVFRLLPEEIQKELLFQSSVPSPALTAPQPPASRPDAATAAAKAPGPEEGEPPFPRSYDRDFPANVDPRVFSELPSDVQRELMSEWKQQKPGLKAGASRKPGRSPVTRGRRAAARGQQVNHLFNYFKPG